MSKIFQRGDTIIEVVLAFAIFSLAAVSTIALINSGLATTQRSLETTLVRQQIDSQGEMLRHLRDTQNPTWGSLITAASLVANPLSLSQSCVPLGSIGSGFYIKPVTETDPKNTSFEKVALTAATYGTPETYAKIDYSDGANRSEGIWIQATRAEGSSIPAYDFYIHACWDSVGLSTPMTLGTIVRIYE